MTIDFTVSNHGSIALIRPQTDAARAWLRDNVEDAAQYLGASLAVEPRFLDGLLDGIANAGLEVTE